MDTALAILQNPGVGLAAGAFVVLAGWGACNAGIPFCKGERSIERWLIPAVMRRERVQQVTSWTCFQYIATLCGAGAICHSGRRHVAVRPV